MANDEYFDSLFLHSINDPVIAYAQLSKSFECLAEWRTE